MKFVYIGATLFLGILGICALFLELNKLHPFWKLALGLLAVVAVILTFSFQMFEKEIDEKKRQYAEQDDARRAEEIKGKLDELKKKEKKGLLTATDYSLYIARYLEVSI